MPSAVSICSSTQLCNTHSLRLIHTFSWEIAFTLGFELDIIRGKRPYRWTIWVSCLLLLDRSLGPERMTRQLYLGTRYFGLATFIVFFLDTDGGKVPCHVSSKIFWAKGTTTHYLSPPLSRPAIDNCELCERTTSYLPPPLTPPTDATLHRRRLCPISVGRSPLRSSYSECKSLSSVLCSRLRTLKNVLLFSVWRYGVAMLSCR